MRLSIVPHKRQRPAVLIAATLWRHVWNGLNDKKADSALPA